MNEPGIRAAPRLFGWKGIALLIAVCTMLGVAEGTLAHIGGYISQRPPEPWRMAVLRNLPIWYAFGLLVPVVVWLTHRFPLTTPPRSRSLAAHAVASLVFPFLHIALGFLVWYGFDIPMGREVEPLREYARITTLFYVMELFLYWVIVGGVLAWTYYGKAREHELAAARLGLRAARLEAGLSQARLQTLRGQLHPHFLFNTLNAISVLARQGRNADVIEVTTRLGQLLRFSLDRAEQTLPLREELAFVERYLRIEQIRFGDRLEVAWRVPDACLDAEVPSLILQPLVENAIKHGIAPLPEGGRIEIGAACRDGRLRLVVADTGVGLSRSAVAREGIGLGNTRARLAQLYGDDHRFDVRSAEDRGVVVDIEIPRRSAGSDQSSLRWSHEDSGNDRRRRAARTGGDPSPAAQP